MKTKRFIISIPEPCSENWNEMTPTERGKFCAHCQKDVIDFSNKTNSEIVNFVKSNKGNFCGRFAETQLEEEFSYREQEKYSNLKYAAALALGLLTTENIVAQDDKTKIEITPINSIKNIPLIVQTDTVKNQYKFLEDTTNLNILQGKIGGVCIQRVKATEIREYESPSTTIFDKLRKIKP